MKISVSAVEDAALAIAVVKFGAEDAVSATPEAVEYGGQ
jgi:hypothetical protein